MYCFKLLDKCFFQHEFVLSFIIRRFHTKPLSQFHDFTMNKRFYARARSQRERNKEEREGGFDRKEQQLEYIDDAILEDFSQIT